MKVFKWQKAYKAKIKTMSNLGLLSEVSNCTTLNEQGTPSDYWEHGYALAEMEKRLDTITLKAKANSGWENGKQVTILQIEGDPLNIEVSGQWDLNIDIQVPVSSIQKSQEPPECSTEAS